MEFTGLGSGVLLALAAVLWLAYLVPSWLRRHEYLSTERNALRLQQTIRVLAETAEVPVTIQAETSARSIAAQQRTLRQQQHRTDAVNRAQAAAVARRHAQTIPPAERAPARIVSGTALAGRRLRRTRALTSLIMLASFSTLVVQVILMATTGIAPAAPAVLTSAALINLTTLAFLGRLGAISRRRSRMAANVGGQARRRTTSTDAPVLQTEQQPRIWTPVAMPKPLYLSRDVIERELIDQQSAVAELASAAAQSDRALRSAQSPAATASMTRPETENEAEPGARLVHGSPTTVSRFAAMGIIDHEHDDGTTPNLDDVLRRRRQAAS